MFSAYLNETTNQKVLGFLAKYPDKEIYERQLARKLGVGYGSAHRALSELSHDGVIKKRQEGKMCFYSIDSSQVGLKYYKILVNLNLIAPLVAQLIKTANRVVLYGSCAQGDDNSASDLDIFIVTSRRNSVMRIIEMFKFARGYEDIHIQSVIKTATELLNAGEAEHRFLNEVEQGIVLWEATKVTEILQREINK